MSEVVQRGRWFYVISRHHYSAREGQYVREETIAGPFARLDRALRAMPVARA